MSKAAAKKIVVCGGNGFVGSRICKYAVARGWDVTSIRQVLDPIHFIRPPVNSFTSRSGEPKWSAVTSSSNPPSWAHQVAWERADIFQPQTYAPLLTNADYIVHSMGILLEADYKGVLQGQENPISGLRKAFARNSPSHSAEQLTYERMNRDSALMLARAAQGAGQDNNKGPSAYLYLSAAGGAPVLPARYIETKREAEGLLASEFPQIRGVFLRAPFMYDTSRAFTIPMAAMTGVGAVFNGLTRGVFGGLMGAAGVKPLPVETVARAAVEALEAEGTRGPVEVPEIEALAEKAWRKGML